MYHRGTSLRNISKRARMSETTNFSVTYSVHDAAGLLVEFASLDLRFALHRKLFRRQVLPCVSSGVLVEDRQARATNLVEDLVAQRGRRQGNLQRTARRAIVIAGGGDSLVAVVRARLVLDGLRELLDVDLLRQRLQEVLVLLDRVGLRCFLRQANDDHAARLCLDRSSVPFHGDSSTHGGRFHLLCQRQRVHGWH